ncbi:helix-turn-helix transcriptional regulator [Paracoccus yeei]|uniref:helix-turn-helix transcriptional regulator n=1 Tax=Paracoccus yeei TaxID=147645 RepID=UPI00174E68AF|nr:AlpA family phage regulatory protein [Paracoccus yeei]
MNLNALLRTDGQPMEQFLRLKDICARTSLSKSEVYRQVKDGRFPPQQRRSHKVAVWKLSDVDAWMRGKDDWA